MFMHAPKTFHARLNNLKKESPKKSPPPKIAQHARVRSLRAPLLCWEGLPSSGESFYRLLEVHREPRYILWREQSKLSPDANDLDWSDFFAFG